MSIARRAAVQHGAAPTARTTASATMKVGIRKAIEEVAALEIRAERLDDVAVGRRVSDAAAASNALGLRLVVETDHRAQRQIRLSGLDVLARRGRRRLQMQHRNAVDHREDAAVAAEDAVVDLVADRAMEQRGRPARAGRRRYGQRRMSRVSMCMSRSRRACSSIGSPVASSGARRKCSTPSQRRASSSSIRANGLFGAHLAAMTAKRGELARHPVARRRRRSVGGSAPMPNASGTMLQKPVSGGAAARRAPPRQPRASCRAASSRSRAAGRRRRATAPRWVRSYTPI